MIHKHTNNINLYYPYKYQAMLMVPKINQSY